MAYYRRIGKSWYYTVRISDANGIRKTVERYGGRTKTEAKQAALDFLATCETTGSYAMVSTMKYADYLDEFLNVYVRPNLKANTQEAYERAIDNIIKPTLGKYTLSQLTPMNIQIVINELSKKYKPSSMDQVLGIIKRSLTQAVDFFNYLSMNPARSVKIPRLEKEVKAETNLEIFGVEEMNKIFRAFPLSHPFFAPIQIAWHTGLRLGECLALQWDDIDMEKQLIYVRHNLNDRHGIELGTPKTKKSARLVPFGQRLKDLLDKIRQIQTDRQKNYEGYYKESNFVCTKRNGEIMTSNAMRFFGVWCKKNIGYGSFHTLRHSHATFLLSEGWTIDDVSKRLGHANTTVTSTTYSHISKERIKKQIEKLEQIYL